MTEENKVQALPHNLIMENRNRLTVSGVSDVDMNAVVKPKTAIMGAIIGISAAILPRP